MLDIKGIIWLEGIVEKLAWKHDVKGHEAMEVLENKPQVRFVEKGHRKGENVYAALGRTKSGRYMIVFFVYKLTKEALILSAKDMTDTERKRYAKT